MKLSSETAMKLCFDKYSGPTTGTWKHDFLECKKLFSSFCCFERCSLSRIVTWKMMQHLRRMRARTTNLCQRQRMRSQTPYVQTPPPVMWSKWTGFRSKKGNCSSNPPKKPAVISQWHFPDPPDQTWEWLRGFFHSMATFLMLVSRALFWCHWCFLVVLFIILCS